MSRLATVAVPENRVFHIVWNTPRDGFRGALPQLRRVLPKTWKVDAGPASSERGPSILVRSPEGRVAHVRVLARSRFDPKDVRDAIVALTQSRDVRRPLLVAAPFLSPRSRELLAAAGASYVDSTGNLRLVLERPPIFVERTGADRDPAREPRPLRSIRGAAAQRVARALGCLPPPYGVRQLARRARLPLASVSRVINLLEREGIITRRARGEVIALDRAALRRRLTQDVARRWLMAPQPV